MNAMTEADDPYCLRPDEADSLLAAAPWRRLVVLGDSIAVHPGDPVDGYRNRTWVERLAASLRLDECLNLGVASARLAEIRAGQLSRALAFRPDLAVVAGGANDALRRSFTPEGVAGELEQIIGPLGGAGALVVTFGCFDVGRTGWVRAAGAGREGGGSAQLPADQRAALSDRMRTLGRVTAEVGRRHGGVHVDFADHPAQARDGQAGGVLSADLLHINGRGHAVVGAEVICALAAITRSPELSRPSSP
jgi:lysophospholipase L1-like esterase